MKKKLVSLLCIITTMSMLVSGCGKKNNADNNSDNPTPQISGNTIGNDALVDHDYAASTVAFTIEDYDVTIEELYIYLLEYFFNNNVDPATVNAAKKQEILNTTLDQVKLEVVEYKLALVTDGVQVTDEDLANAKKIADNFYNYFGETFISYFGVSRQAIDDMFVRQAYIERLKMKATRDFVDEYTAQYQKEYADIKFYSVYYVLFPAIKYDENNNPVADPNGGYQKLTEEEMQAQYELATELRQKALDNIKNGEADGNMEELAAEYKIEFASGVERGYTGAYTKELNDAIDKMSNGDISDVIETDAGYMIVRMDNDNDVDFRDYFIEYSATQNASTMFPTLQQNWMDASGAANVALNNDAISAMKVQEMCQLVKEYGYTLNGGN